MKKNSECSPRLCGLKHLLLCSMTVIMLAAPCCAESEWPLDDTSPDQIKTVNPEDLQPPMFESSSPAEAPAEVPVADTPPSEPQPTVAAPADVPAETAAPAENPAEIPAVPPEPAVEAPAEDPAAVETPTTRETPPEGVPPQFSENPIISVPEDPPPAPPEP